MGFDEETGDGHCVFWAEKRSITVERSVEFNFEEEVIVGQLPLEGENSTCKLKTSQIVPIEPASTEEIVDAPIPDHLGEVFKDEQPAEG